MKLRALVGVALVAVVVVACSSSETGSGFDASGGGCCQPSPTPACCMTFGGWSSNGNCESVCDGIPTPNQGWKMVNDEHGCKKWEQPYSCFPAMSGASCCGVVVVPDSGSDAPADAPADAPNG